MKKILKNKVIIFIIALSIVILQPVTGFLTAKASALPNPKPNLVVVPKPDSADIIDFATRTRIDAYDAKLTNMGKLSQNVDYGTAAAALEFAYDAAGLVADNGVYKDEYKARVQYIKDNSVLPAPLNNLESEIFFATLDYADMTIGYYLDAAGNRIGKGCIKFKEGAEKITQAMLDAIKDTNFWSKPFKNIDGKTYNNMPCISSTAYSFSYDYTYGTNCHIHIVCTPQFEAYGFTLASGSIVFFSKVNMRLQVHRANYENGEFTNEGLVTLKPGSIGNGWYQYTFNALNHNIGMSSPYPLLSNSDLSSLQNRLMTLSDADYDTSQTGISFMPAVVPATVPTSG